VHSEIVEKQQKTRLLEDIVRLCQEKNLILESKGRPDCIQVGIIEARVGWHRPINAEKYGKADKLYEVRRATI